MRKKINNNNNARNKVNVFPHNTIAIDMFGSSKYRNSNYRADDYVAVVHTDHLSKQVAIFISAACHKATHGQIPLWVQLLPKDADELNLMLPVKNGAQDYAFMKNLISAVHKIVIKDVIHYAYCHLVATKQPRKS